MLLQGEFQEESHESPPPRLDLLEHLRTRVLDQNVKEMCESCCHILYTLFLYHSLSLYVWSNYST